MTKRKPISKKIRFEVFKRDAFTCQYCGATPPKVILNIDHIHPVSKGGDNSQDNLITSCFDCNLGKSATPLTCVPQSLADKTAELREREAQVKGYYSIIAKTKQRLDSEAFDVAAVLDEKYRESLDRGWHRSIKMFIGKLDFPTVLESMEIAVAARPYSDYQAFKYFCGVCWNKIREKDNG